MYRLLGVLGGLAVLLICLDGCSSSAVNDYLPSEQPPLLDRAEQEAVYDILAAVNPEVDWSYLLGVDLCTAGPHGIVCEIDADEPGRAHVVELNVGYVSDYSNNPACSATNASFSPAITRLPYLSKLFFYGCFLSARTSLPPYLWSLGPQLQELVFQSNPALSGSLPSDFGTVLGLRRLIIEGTAIAGEIPASIGRLRNLQQLDLSNNALTGVIPSAVGQLTELVVLDLSQNALVGSIPHVLAPLVKLSKLDLSGNNLSGGIPASIGSLRSLELLDLSDNRLIGGVSRFLGELTGLKNLHLRGNPLGGILPEFWNQFRELEGVDLSGAGLEGRIPATMGELKEMSYLALDHNNLSGVIPPELAELPKINHIDLSHNRLGGEVPFPRVMVKRLGARLRLEGNEELCMDPQVVVSFSEKISGCASSSSLSPSVELRVSNDNSSENRRSRWLRCQEAMLCAVVFLLFFH